MLLTMEQLKGLKKLGIYVNNDGNFMYVPEKKLTEKEVKRLLSFDKTHYESYGKHVIGIEKLTQ